MKSKTRKLFLSFFENERTSGIVLIAVTLVSLFISNSSWLGVYSNLWDYAIGDFTIAAFVNDGLMSIFFLLVGLELKREFQVGELASRKKAILPLVSALGGMVVPAVIYLLFNWGTFTQTGYGIPMATDIAFALGVLSLVGNKIPFSIKVFLTALAVIDDLGAIVVIALFYSQSIHWVYLVGALITFGGLLLLNRYRIRNLTLYLLGGVLMWYFMHHSGVHATIAGVLLAFAIPSELIKGSSPSTRLQHVLEKPVPFLILPLFAMANTVITIQGSVFDVFSESYGLGVFFGLVLGKPIGILFFSWFAIKFKWAHLPSNAKWKQMIGVACLGGIGFTMSIFVTLLAFDDEQVINNSKLMILLSSFTAAILGYSLLKMSQKRNLFANKR